MDLLEHMKLHYGINFDKLELIRDWIGQVYEVANGDTRFITKVFRNEYTQDALQSIEVMTYLRENKFQVPDIFMTLQGSRYFVYNNQIVVLYEYIDGEGIDKAGNLFDAGTRCGWMRKLMETYGKDVSNHGYEFFIKRYLDIMKMKDYKGIDKFTKLGNELWEKIKNLPISFIHGDFHSGNMFLNKGEIVLFDFDACAIASPVYDIATYCDASDYFDLSDNNFELGMIQTQRNVEEFVKGYKKYFHLSKDEEKAIYYFIAIRHFDIQATIIASQGLNCVNEQFLDNQYLWLEKWMDRLNNFIIST